MSTREDSGSDDPIIEHRDQLATPMAAGEKPKDRWRIGTEHEKLVFCRKTLRAPSYEEPCGIRDILINLQRFGWEPVEQGGYVIALRGVDGDVSLAPAGQLELAGPALSSLHRNCTEPFRPL